MQTVVDLDHSLPGIPMPRPLLTCSALLLTLAFVATPTTAQTTGLPPDRNTAPQSPARAPTLTTQTNLVVVDVVVTDRAGHNVHGLKQTDFTVTEDNHAEPLRSFDEHTAPTQLARPEPPLQLPPGVFTNYAPVPHTDALNILLFDELNTPLLDQSYVRSQLLDYIRTASPADRVAIFGLTTHLIFLQGFTSDPALLRVAIDKKSIRNSQLLNNAATGGDSHELSKTLELGHDPEIAAAVARVRELEAHSEAFNVALRAHYTLDAMNALARYLANFPGRKNLIWFSGSFPINILPDTSLPDPFAVSSDLGDEVRDTATLLTGAQVALYPIDARGLFNNSAYDPSQRGNPQTFNRDFAEENQRRIQEFSTMRTMADQTGGHAFVNNNGFKEAVSTILRTGANFYTLTYAPSDLPSGIRFRHIGVHLSGAAAQQNLALSYRRGYFSVAKPPSGTTAPNQKAVSPGTGISTPVPGSANVLRSAMLRGAPPNTEIIFKAQILPAAPASTPPESSPDPITRVNSNSKLAHGPWRRYAVSIAATPGQLMTRAPDGSYNGIAELITHCYTAEGVLVSSVSESARMKLSAQDARQAAGSGVILREVISVPDRGDLYLRLGLHSLLNNRVGSLEVPVALIKNLSPSPSPAAPVAAGEPAPAPAMP